MTLETQTAESLPATSRAAVFAKPRAATSSTALTTDRRNGPTGTGRKPPLKLSVEHIVAHFAHRFTTASDAVV